MHDCLIASFVFQVIYVYHAFLHSLGDPRDKYVNFLTMREEKKVPAIKKKNDES